MTVTPETLDAPLCEWCTKATYATAQAKYFDARSNWNVQTQLCEPCSQQFASEFTSVTLYPLANKPEYTILESGAEPMTGEWTIAQLELAARYGAPYPVCGDLTTLKSHRGTDMFESWTGHDPSGEQY